MTMHWCNSKYHVGQREISIDKFKKSPSGKISNRCIDCVRATCSNYQRTEHGKRIKAQHYANNIEKYKETDRKSRMSRINADKGASYLFVTAKRRARRYNLDFALCMQDIIVPDICPVLGIPLFFSDTRTNNTPSLDRVDNTKGYIPGNVMVISWRANFIKRDLTLAEINLLQHYILSNMGDVEHD